MNKKILIVDDEKEIVDLLEVYLSNDGYSVYKCYNGLEAMKCIKQSQIDLAILDIMLPDIDGFRLCQKIREKFYFPIIMLTAKIEDSDKIMGLTIGADDYITKPFNILEVKARIKAIIRRNSKKSKAAQKNERIIEVSDLKLDLDSRRVFEKDKELNLTAKEFDILELLTQNPDKVYSREKLLNIVWGNKLHEAGDVRTVDVHVRRLREKIEPNPSEPKYIHTKWGVGYYFKE